MKTYRLPFIASVASAMLLNSAPLFAEGGTILFPPSPSQIQDPTGTLANDAVAKGLFAETDKAERKRSDAELEAKQHGVAPESSPKWQRADTEYQSVRSEYIGYVGGVVGGK